MVSAVQAPPQRRGRRREQQPTVSVVADTPGQRRFKVFAVVVLSLVVAATLYPFVNVLAQSFSDSTSIAAGKVNLVPRGFNVDTYRVVMSDADFWTGYRNTIVYTLVATAISMALTTCFAYATSKRHLKGRKFFITFAVFTMFFNGGIIPNYVLITSLGMRNTIWAVVLPSAISVFNVLVMKTFFEAMPEELEEAASIDGLNTYGILLRIVLPLSKAVLATMLLFYAVSHWNSWFQAFLYLDDKNLFPVTIYLRNMIAGVSSTAGSGAEAADVGMISANIQSVTMVLTVLPIVCIYPFIQKYFVSGVMLGSVKQ